MTISLEKRTEDAQSAVISLLKKEQAKGIDLGELTAQVELCLDYSGSMKKRYRSQRGEPSEVQTVVDRALALSLSGLDDDGVVPVHFFQDFVFPTEHVTRQNHAGFVDRWTQDHKTGGTNYVPAMEAALPPPTKRSGLLRRKRAVGDEKDLPPKLILFVTDGAPNDRKRTIEFVAGCSDRPVFWQFIALGYKADYLKDLDTMGNRVVDNVGLIEWEETTAMSDTEFFNAVIGEFFTGWLPAARQEGITRR